MSAKLSCHQFLRLSPLLRSHPSTSIICKSQQIHRTTPARFVATARRTTKALRTKPSPSAFPSAKKNVPPNDHIVFNPPPTLPSPYHTPPLFMPMEDPRRTLLQESHLHNNPYAPAPNNPYAAWISKPTTKTAPTRDLPPPVRLGDLKPKVYQLTAEDVAEIRRLRGADPFQNTVIKLAKQFQCSEKFIALCGPKNPERKKWAVDNLQAVKDRWGPKRRHAREERTKRRATWGRDQ